MVWPSACFLVYLFLVPLERDRISQQFRVDGGQFLLFLPLDCVGCVWISYAAVAKKQNVQKGSHIFVLLFKTDVAFVKGVM